MKKEKIYKIFECKNCLALIAVPLEQGRERVICLYCDKASTTGTEKRFVDIIKKKIKYAE
jgi:hypothetical protein